MTLHWPAVPRTLKELLRGCEESSPCDNDFLMVYVSYPVHTISEVSAIYIVTRFFRCSISRQCMSRFERVGVNEGCLDQFVLKWSMSFSISSARQHARTCHGDISVSQALLLHTQCKSFMCGAICKLRLHEAIFLLLVIRTSFCAVSLRYC